MSGIPESSLVVNSSENQTQRSFEWKPYYGFKKTTIPLNIMLILVAAGCTAVQVDQNTQELVSHEVGHTFEMPDDESEWKYIEKGYEVPKGHSWWQIAQDYYWGRYGRHINLADAVTLLQKANRSVAYDGVLNEGDVVDIPAPPKLEGELVDNMYAEPLYALPNNLEPTPTLAPGANSN